MKKTLFFLAALMLGAMATWAQLPGLSFTIYPESTSWFSISYSTYKAPAGNVVFIDWGNGVVEEYSNGNSGGSNPKVQISGIVTNGKPIKIYSKYLDAIEINFRAEAIRCESNNPHLQYIYYLHDNLNSQALEVLYATLNDRNSKAWV